MVLFIFFVLKKRRKKKKKKKKAKPSKKKERKQSFLNKQIRVALFILFMLKLHKPGIWVQL